jgi:hypothetical protein
MKGRSRKRDQAGRGRANEKAGDVRCDARRVRTGYAPGETAKDCQKR